MGGFVEQATRRPDVAALVAGGGHGEGGDLRRSLGYWHLTLLSVGAMVGTGIFFVLGGTVEQAGPAVVLSFVIAGFVSVLSALSYAQLASTVPVSGSAYSYAYAIFGHGTAWLVGAFLTMEYGLSSAAVAVGWGAYINDFLSSFGVTLPEEISAPPGEGGVVNVPAAVVIGLAAVLLLRGISESATVNNVMVVLKFVILGVFVWIAFGAFDADHFEPFLPHGYTGVWAAAGAAFFAFIGFDTASTAAEEARNPQRDMPRAIVTAVFVVLVLYLAVAISAVGAKPPEEFQDGQAILAQIAREVTGSEGAARFISAGAVISIFTVVLAVMYGQTRVTFVMARDGFLPRLFDSVNARQVPNRNIVLTAVTFGTLAALIPIGPLLDVTVAGTFLACIVVHLAVLVSRRTRPDLVPRFRMPFGPVIPVLGIGSCLYLLYSLGWRTLGITAAISAFMAVVYVVRYAIAARRSDGAR